MTLPEKVKDVTQSEWLSYRERLAEAASQLALAMAWGAEVCATLDEAEHAMHMRIRGEYDRTIADSWRAKVAEVEQRAERAEAERDETRRERDDAREVADERGARALKAERERDEARAQLAAVVAAWKAIDKCGDVRLDGPRAFAVWDAMQEAVFADPAQAAHEHDERVRAEERERCAKECEAYAHERQQPTVLVTAMAIGATECAERIRALGSRS